MKNKKIIGLLLSLVLVLGATFPGTLATSTDTAGTDIKFSIGTTHEASAAPEPSEDSAHIDTCAEGCTGGDCECSCHELSLYERLMACETLDELFAIVDAASEDELQALTDEENAEVEAKISILESEPLPPVVLEECENESVISEIIYPAVNFDNVAPFGAPVEG